MVLGGCRTVLHQKLWLPVSSLLGVCTAAVQSEKHSLWSVDNSGTQSLIHPWTATGHKWMKIARFIFHWMREPSRPNSVYLPQASVDVEPWSECSVAMIGVNVLDETLESWHSCGCSLTQMPSMNWHMPRMLHRIGYMWNFEASSLSRSSGSFCGIVLPGDQCHWGSLGRWFMSSSI